MAFSWRADDTICVYAPTLARSLPNSAQLRCSKVWGPGSSGRVAVKGHYLESGTGSNTKSPPIYVTKDVVDIPHSRQDYSGLAGYTVWLGGLRLIDRIRTRSAARHIAEQFYTLWTNPRHALKWGTPGKYGTAIDGKTPATIGKNAASRRLLADIIGRGKQAREGAYVWPTASDDFGKYLGLLNERTGRAPKVPTATREKTVAQQTLGFLNGNGKKKKAAPKKAAPKKAAPKKAAAKKASTTVAARKKAATAKKAAAAKKAELAARKKAAAAAKKAAAATAAKKKTAAAAAAARAKRQKAAAEARAVLLKQAKQEKAFKKKTTTKRKKAAAATQRKKPAYEVECQESRTVRGKGAPTKAEAQRKARARRASGKPTRIRDGKTGRYVDYKR